MEKKKTKSEIVKLLLNKNLETEDEEQLLDLLIDQPIAIDVDREDDKNKTFGDQVADKLTSIAGSWTFILGFSLFLIGWILINLFFIQDLDPYPFILLNLVLSCVAALQAPIIMMSQNREAKKEVLRNQNDYKIDLKSELILEELHDKMELILKNQKVILASLEQKEKQDDSK